MGDKVVAVASSVYNLAGPESRRPDFLKSLIIGAVLQEAPSLAEVINTGYRNGPGLRLRRFASWARNDPDFLAQLGTTTGELRTNPVVDFEHDPATKAVILAALPVGAGQIARIDFAEINAANILYWARRHVAENHPERLSDDFESDYDEDTGEITVTWTQGTEDPVDDVVDSDTPFTPSAPTYDDAARYLYVGYTPYTEEAVEAAVPGPVVQLGSTNPFPSTAGWQQTLNTATTVQLTLNTTMLVESTYSDGRNPTISSSLQARQETYQEKHQRYQTQSYMGSTGTTKDEVYSIRTIRDQWETPTVVSVTTDKTAEIDLGNGVTRYDTITITEDWVLINRSYQDSTQRIVHNTWLTQKILIYKENSGNTDLDALFQNPVVDAGIFFPVIPLRFKNRAISAKQFFWKVQLPADLDPLQVGDVLYFALARDSGTTDVEKYAKALISEVDDGTGLTTIFANRVGTIYVEFQDALTYELAELLSKGKSYVVTKDDPNPLLGGDPATWFPVAGKPLQLDADSASVNTYQVARKAFKKAMGSDFDDLMESINGNDDISDIDYCQAIFGVSLNVQENACRKYVYKFFQNLMGQYPIESSVEVDAWLASWQAAHESQKNFDNWWVTQGGFGRGNYYQKPEQIPYPTIPWKSLAVKSQHQGVLVYRTSLHWAFITEETGTGILKPDVKPGEVWFEVKPDPLLDDVDLYNFAYSHLAGSQYLNNKITLYYQETRNTWRRMTIIGLHHKNEVYRHKFVVTTAKEALENSETHSDGELKESGFIIPLHENVFRQMSLKDQTQMATACCFLVFNCYEAREKKWYESDWFQVLLIVAVIVIAVATAIITGGASLGLLGSATAVGTALGASGTVAIVLGAIVNALAAVAVSAIIGAAVTELFGEKWGAIIGAVLTFALTLGAGTSFDPAQAFETVTSPEGLMGLSMVVGNGTTAYLQAAANELAEQTREMLKKASKELAKRQEEYEEDFGKGKKIDPAWVSKYISELTEKPESFLARTLLTGSDIVELNLSALRNFADYTLQLKLP